MNTDRIPKTDSIQELAQFWDTHELTDFDDQLEEATKPVFDREIDVLKDALSGRFGAKQIFVFGSHAYGKPDQESDIDLCIIADLKQKRKIEMIRDIRRALLHLISSPMDILVYDEEEFGKRARLEHTLEHKIMTDGMRVYG